MRQHSYILLIGFLLESLAFSATVPKAPQSTIPNIGGEKSAAKPTEVKATITSLGAITTEVEGDLTVVTARLNKIPEWKDVTLEDHGTFLQIKLPQTQIPVSGEFIDGNGPFLKKMATFQLPDEDGALRLFINQDAAKAKLATTSELLGDRLVITIDHKKLEQLIAPVQTKPSEDSQSIQTSADVSKVNLAPQATKSKTTPATESDFNSEPQKDLYAQLTKVAGFCAVMFLALLGAQWLRVKRRKSGRFNVNGEAVDPTAMKILSSITLGPKQKLTLVQVGYQQILLGVGQDSVNLISSTDLRPRTPSFAKQLDAANPNADVKLKSMEEILPPRAQRKPPSSSATVRPSETPVRGGRINVGVGDEGAKNLNLNAQRKDDDITKILRDRLRNLPPG